MHCIKYWWQLWFLCEVSFDEGCSYESMYKNYNQAMCKGRILIFFWLPLKIRVVEEIKLEENFIKISSLIHNWLISCHRWSYEHENKGFSQKTYWAEDSSLSVSLSISISLLLILLLPHLSCHVHTERKLCETYPSSVTCKTKIARLVDCFL